MKKLLFVIATAFFVSTLFAQTVTLTFTAKDAANHYVQLNRVIITNLTKSWQETIYWPDTVLTMQNGTGIDDHTLDGGFALSQNNPNPFSGTTEVSLTTVDEGKVDLDIKDMNGRIIETQNLVSLQPGNHQFRISLSTAGTYVMTARQNGKTSSIKMICNGGGGSNNIDYLGMVQTITVVLKSSTNKPFNFGDQMEYVGYAFINNTEAESQRITQVQGSSQLFTLQFAETQIYYMPTVTTNTVSGITSNAATCGGNVTSDGGAAVTERGVCWSLSHNPTISSDHTTNGSGTGAFTSSLTGLYAGRTYYVRAYARNSVGTSYGNEVSFTTSATLPEVTTGTVSNLTGTSAYCGNNYVNSVVAAPVTARGVCWSTSQNPTLNDSHTSDGSGTGSFGSSITGLAANTVYYVRAYATNSVGTAYGNVVSFTTLSMDGQPCPNAATLTDIDGNTYNTVQIGDQCWMKENLRTTHYADGVSIPVGNMSGEGSNILPYYYILPYQAQLGYGYLYNWPAVMHNACSSNANPSGIQGICPTGWHVPSLDEWWQLESYVGSQSQYQCDNSIAKALASTTGWQNSSTSCAIGNNPSTNNATGFSAIPAGVWFSSGLNGAGLYGAGQYTYFWTSNGNSVDYASSRYLSADNTYISGNSSFKNLGLSVRCVLGVGSNQTLPQVITNPATGISSVSAICGGTVTADGNDTVFSRGVCWSTSHNPTLNDSHTTDGSGTGGFTSNITGLAANTTYYVRAYATNSLGTSYGEQWPFTTTSGTTGQGGLPCPGVPTVTDHEGNVYNTVLIGNQCWMRENLRTTTSPSTGTYLIPDANSVCTYTGKQARWYNNESSTYAPMKYGLLYNWYAAVDTFNTMFGETSVNTDPANQMSVTFTGHRRGICPVGWHLPSKMEWEQMADSVSSQSIHLCGYENSIVKALADTVGWVTEYGYCWIGNDLSANNGTGFSALPAGYYSYNGYNAVGTCTHFWSATVKSNDSYGVYIYDFSLYSNNIYWYLSFSNVRSCYSVRCIKDETGGGGDTTFVSFPTVFTVAPSNITTNSASCGGNVTADGGVSVTVRGVCWSTSPNPTVSDSHTMDGSGTGTFTSSLTGLAAGTTYYVRAYATNNAGTAYGNQVSFTTNHQVSCPNTPTVTDYDGNVYNTVQIGNQCWMQENLRTTHYADGTSISLGSYSSGTPPYLYYYPFNSSSTNPTYGYLYNWAAVMHGASSSNASPSGVQGICPIGWHVPSDTEWGELENYVGGQSNYLCGNDSNFIAKALASPTGWTSSEGQCAVGNMPSSNNATGFGALPAGAYSIDYNSCGNFSYSAFFWTSTGSTSQNAYRRVINYNSASLNSYNNLSKNNGFSVRCLKD